MRQADGQVRPLRGAPIAGGRAPLPGTRRVHFIGIGGVGMSGIAQMCIAEGFGVSGSDARASSLTQRLAELGATIQRGHCTENVAGADLVVVSSAIRPENPELVRARELGLPVKKRAEMLGWFMEGRTGIAIAGAHGKTTTTSLVGHILTAAGLDPTLVVGGEAINLRSNVRLGRSGYVVVEADESDASFLYLPPRAVVVTNIDDDHMDHYQTMEAMESTFESFISRVGPGGLAVLCGDDARLRRMAERFSCEVILYGLFEGVRARARGVRHEGRTSHFDVVLDGEVIGPLTINIPGLHNVVNATGAVALGRSLGIDPEVIGAALPTFAGVARRFQLVGDAAGVKVFDDYAHHPTEIRATLASARLSTPRRLVVLFQPHRYSRTRLLAKGFGSAFADADVVMLLPVYAAGELEPEGGVSTELIYAELVRQHPYVITLEPQADLDLTARLAATQLEEGDWLLTVGAGDVNTMGPRILSVLRQTGAAHPGLEAPGAGSPPRGVPPEAAASLPAPAGQGAREGR